MKAFLIEIKPRLKVKYVQAKSVKPFKHKIVENEIQIEKGQEKIRFMSEDL